MANSGLTGTRIGIVSMRVIFKSRSPLKKLVHECSDFPDDAFEESLALFGRGKIGVSNGSRFRNFMKFIHEINGPAVLHIGLAVNIAMFGTVAFAERLFDALGMQVEHDR